MIRLMIADDHTMFRDCLKHVLEFGENFHVVAEAKDGAAMLDLARRIQPEIVLLDAGLPCQRWRESLLFLAHQSPKARTILVDETIVANAVVDALRLGARGVVENHAPMRVLCDSIRAVAAGDYWVGKEVRSNLVEYLAQLIHGRQERRYGLTGREIEIIAAVVCGCSNREIAERLKISESTVKHHIANIFDKTGQSTRMELAVFAREKRLAA